MLPSSLRYPPGGKPWLLYGVLAASLIGNVALGVVVSRAEGSGGGASPPEDATIVAVGEDTTVSHEAVPPDQVPPLPEPLGVASRAGTHVFHGTVASSLSQTFTAADHPSPMALSQVYARLFAWDLDLRRDLHRGDLVEVLFEQPDVGEPVILAAALTSQPGAAEERRYVAYRYQAPGDRFPSYWTADGTEVPKRLIDGPLTDYEQISSLLKDRPTHEGMDFKTPIGTPVVVPRAGRVTQVNWNHAANGNCVEVQYTDGVTAKFLHLNEQLVKAGEAVTAGQVIGKTGNTGRSTGPHLHYQLERGSTVLDPVDYHGTLRRALQPDARPQFDAVVKQMDEQLAGRLAAR
jgi:murein DD-endopeptidase